MRIGLDGMGGDHAPVETVKGAVEAAALLREEDSICIFGDEEQIRRELENCEYSGDRIQVVATTEVITNEDSPVKAVRRKKDSSLVVGLNHLKEEKIDVFISAGNTGALMSGALLTLGRIRGIDRPALATLLPPMKGTKPMFLMDSGANSECKPANLLEFAVMGSVYMNKVMGIESPTVGLINIGAEATKGNTMTKAAYELLDQSNLNFIGNVEARDLPESPADVVVCDGFTGNIVLKYTEGMAMAFMHILKDKLSSGVQAKLGAALLMSKLKDFKKMFDYSEYGGAPFLGVRGAVLKMHGSSNANAVKNTIMKSVAYVENEVVKTIHDEIMKIAEETEETLYD
ncbi:MAG: phosphate acyltransferase PlsX [Firmicutes bacterium]|nr:phosphate acyltransferase PlsX [Bacillota bacterium]MBR6503779.1 phosphate acyltransferase PlsX [Bacillota bacterium]